MSQCVRARRFVAPSALLAWAASLALPAAAAEPLALGEPEVLTPAGDHGDVTWSADGRTLRFTGAKSRGLYEVPASGGDTRLLPGHEDTVGNRSLAGDGPIDVIRDDLVLRTGEDEVWLTHGEDRFFDPQLSPDRTHVAFVGLASGVHVIELATGRVLHAGAGTRPTWTPDGTWVVFERTADDGTHLVGSELMALRRDDGHRVALTSTPHTAERHPAVSPDGTRLAFVVDGAVWVADLVVAP